MNPHGYFNRQLIRDIQGENLLELFLVTAIASILGIRFFLAMTGYPQVGGHGLHIAHVLVGGIFMLMCIVILLSFLNKSARDLAAVLGGFGFGAFIDELGKFVTSDNNYFFQPTVGLIYVTFILLYFLVKAINRRRWLTEEERLINVLEISKEAVLSNMDLREKQIAIDLLDESDQTSTVVKSLKDLLGTIESAPVPSPGVYTRMREHVRGLYRRVVKRRWFTNAFVGFFLLQAVVSLLVSLDLTIGLDNSIFCTIAAIALLAIYRYFRSMKSTIGRVLCALVMLILAVALAISLESMKLPALPTVDWLQIGFTVLAGMLVVAGIYSLRKNRLRAYNYFKNSVLVYIFFVQVFTFFDYQFYGLAGLGVNILTLGVLRYMISQESRENVEKEIATAALSNGFDLRHIP